MPDTPFIVMAAPNGARLQKSDHHNIPISAEELGYEAARLVEAGVSVVHLHVRDKQGKHSLDVGLYEQALACIKKQVGDRLILQITTEAVGIYNRYEQMDCVRQVKPEAVSLALREICPKDSNLNEAAAFFEECQKQRIWPQYILYSIEDIERFNRYRKDGVFHDDAPFALFVLGRYSVNLTGEPSELDDFLGAMENEQDFPWAACCFGQTEAIATEKAFKEGGHVRIGFENNRYMRDGRIASSNAALIEDHLHALDTASRPIASVDWIKNRLMNW